MTSGTPEADQKRVLSGFQYRSACASRSALDANVISSPAVPSQATRTAPSCPARPLVPAALHFSVNQNPARSTIARQAVIVKGKLTQPRLLMSNPIGCYVPGTAAFGS